MSISPDGSTRIVVLDEFTLNPGDLSWSELQLLGRCEIYDRTPQAEVEHRIRDADIVLTNKAVVDEVAIKNAAKLRYIGVLASGYNVVDIEAAQARNVTVTNVPGYGTRSVTQATFALLLELCNGAGRHNQAVQDGRWATCPDFSFWDQPLIELQDLTLGIVGLGSIGQAVAALGRAFGMNVLGNSRTPREIAGVSWVDLETLFRQSDVVSLHCPLSPETHHIIDTQRLSWMKSSALLLNTARGDLIDEPALRHALENGVIAGAGLDVLATEPPVAGSPLIGAPNCIITPHNAWATQSARARLMGTAIANLHAFLDGHPRNVVSA